MPSLMQTYPFIGLISTNALLLSKRMIFLEDALIICILKSAFTDVVTIRLVVIIRFTSYLVIVLRFYPWMNKLKIS